MGGEAPAVVFIFQRFYQINQFVILIIKIKFYKGATQTYFQVEV
jgi:hypothetical protein